MRVIPPMSLKPCLKSADAVVKMKKMLAGYRNHQKKPQPTAPARVKVSGIGLNR